MNEQDNKATNFSESEFKNYIEALCSRNPAEVAEIVTIYRRSFESQMNFLPSLVRSLLAEAKESPQLADNHLNISKKLLDNFKSLGGVYDQISQVIQRGRMP